MLSFSVRLDKEVHICLLRSQWIFFFLQEPGIQNSRLVVELEGLCYKGGDDIRVQCTIYKNNKWKQNPQVIIDKNNVTRNIFTDFSGEVMAN